jgi:hypothetical protein
MQAVELDNSRLYSKPPVKPDLNQFDSIKLLIQRSKIERQIPAFLNLGR